MVYVGMSLAYGDAVALYHNGRDRVVYEREVTEDFALQGFAMCDRKGEIIIETVEELCRADRHQKC